MSHEVAVAMGVTYRPLSLADIKIRPTAADGEELTRLAEWNKKFGTSAPAEAEVAVPQSGGCLALCQQPACSQDTGHLHYLHYLHYLLVLEEN